MRQSSSVDFVPHKNLSFHQPGNWIKLSADARVFVQGSETEAKKDYQCKFNDLANLFIICFVSPLSTCSFFLFASIISGQETELVGTDVEGLNNLLKNPPSNIDEMDDEELQDLIDKLNVVGYT